MTTDILMTSNEENIYDISLDENGDIKAGDFFDSSLLYSIYGEQRAAPHEVPESHRRRGWIGNEFSDYENGSKLWLYEQSKITRTLLNGIQREAAKATQWIVDDGYAVGNISTKAILKPDGSLELLISIQRPSSQVDQRFFKLWNNTGVNNNAD